MFASSNISIEIKIYFRKMESTALTVTTINTILTGQAMIQVLRHKSYSI